jgi:hypothetical protein
MNAGDMMRAVVIGVAVALPVACLLALLMVSYERREPIPWRAILRAIRGR